FSMSASLDGLPLELSCRIIVYLPLIDRLSLRICCSALEKAVAASDLFLPTANRRITIDRSVSGDVRVTFGGICESSEEIRLHADTLSNLCHLRRRIGSKIYARELYIERNEVIDARVDNVIADFVQGCEVETVLIGLFEDPSPNFRDFLLQNVDKRFDMSLTETILDEEFLRSLQHPSEIEFRSPTFTISTGLFLHMVTRGDTLIRTPITIKSIDEIHEIVKNFSEKLEDEQNVDFGVDPLAFKEFKMNMAGKKEWRRDDGYGSDYGETWAFEHVRVREQPESENLRIELFNAFGLIRTVTL
ncbi:hypothetical protein PMAYCL1PPCAC_20505, partial [Pristionchus mayeri]